MHITIKQLRSIIIETLDRRAFLKKLGVGAAKGLGTIPAFSLAGDGVAAMIQRAKDKEQYDSEEINDSPIPAQLSDEEDEALQLPT